MPDHLHLVVEGTDHGSDLKAFVSSFKQRSGFEHSRRTKAALWQMGYHDRVLRRDEHLIKAISYVLNNPVRAGLVARPEDYRWSGSERFTMDELLTDLTRRR